MKENFFRGKCVNLRDSASFRTEVLGFKFVLTNFGCCEESFSQFSEFLHLKIPGTWKSR